ncbi:MAG TPA: tetratricopeptide repeat protein [Pyrinomonadaceae bacterium]|nr:tetratricopeptide repeat protein [Pyrinomonadaceae bacterium]
MKSITTCSEFREWLTIQESTKEPSGGAISDLSATPHIRSGCALGKVLNSRGDALATNWQIGGRIQNRWEIHKILRGGMGIVYIVYDHEHHSAYAAKTFQDEIFALSPVIAHRFTQEALSWLNLDIHQNVTTAQFVETIEGKPYLFLEYVSGGDISRWIGTTRLTEDLPQVLRFAIHFCDGMTHVVSKGIKAHRDIKPQNCLITEDGTLKVTDFGLAKVFDDAGLTDTETPDAESLSISLSRTGIAAGTPTHMAPEQFDDAKWVDVRADIYSFGVMLYQMLTGRLPFVGRTWQQFQQLHKTQLPPPLGSQHSTLKTVIETCLAKKAAHRFADFSALREELAGIYEVLTGETAPEPVRGAELSALDWSNKGASLSRLGHSEEAIACHDRALEINPRDAEAWTNRGTALDSQGRSEEAIACFHRALEINPRLAETWSNKGIALRSLGRSEEAIECYERALEINPSLAETLINKGIALGSLGRSEESIACYDRALEINPRDTQAWVNKGATLRKLGRAEEAIACFDCALELNPRDGMAWINKGGALRRLGRSEEAIACFDRSLDINPRDERAWINKAAALDSLGRSEEEIACYDRALEINPRLAGAWYDKGVALGILGRSEEEIVCYDRALEINPRDENAWGNKGNALSRLGRSEEAIACHDRALEVKPRDERAWINKAAALVRLGRPEEATACCDRALEINPHYAEAWYNKGTTFGNSGRIPDALTCFEEAHRLGFPQATQAIARCRQLLDRR